MSTILAEKNKKQKKNNDKQRNVQKHHIFKFILLLKLSPIKIPLNFKYGIPAATHCIPAYGQNTSD